MLPEIAVEALRFLSRQDLDKACAVSKWLDAMITQSCDVYPLRPVHRMALLVYNNGFKVKVSIKEDDDSRTYHSISTMDEVVYLTASLLRHSYLGRLKLGDPYRGKIALSPDNWTALSDAMRSGAVQHLQLNSMDLCALDSDTLLSAVGFRGLHSLEVERCVVPSGFVTDDLLRSSVAKHMALLWFSENETDTPHTLTEDAVLDFCFPADAESGGQPRKVSLEGSGASDVFLKKFFERLHSSPVRLSGTLMFFGAPKQRGLSAYAHYLALDWMQTMGGVFKLPSSIDENTSYMVFLEERSSYISVRFYRS